MHRSALSRSLLATAVAVSLTTGVMVAAAGPVAAAPSRGQQAEVKHGAVFTLTTNLMTATHDTAKSTVSNIR